VLNEMAVCVMKHQKLAEIIHVAHSTKFEMQFPPSGNHEFETPQNLFQAYFAGIFCAILV